MTEPEHCFASRCRATLGPLLESFNYLYVGTYSRPRGVAVEFVNSKHHLFAACEGDVLYVDLILWQKGSDYVRVSLNQALWFNGVRSLIGLSSCNAQLEMFACEAEVSSTCISMLEVNHADLDSRYCFPMDQPTSQKYFSEQRGK